MCARLKTLHKAQSPKFIRTIDQIAEVALYIRAVLIGCERVCF